MEPENLLQRLLGPVIPSQINPIHTLRILFI
jgi:hypothetical protein